MKFLFNFCLLALSAPNLLSVSARDVPANVRDFYNSVKKAGQCRKKLKDGFYSIDPSEGGKNGKLFRASVVEAFRPCVSGLVANQNIIHLVFAYCGDHLSDDKIIYIQGPKGKFANMDIDCDGEQHGPGDDGRCESSGDTQSQTSFKDTVASYKAGVKDLNAFVHSYVVFGNVGKKNHYIEFKPEDHGVKPLSVMAVVCGDKMVRFLCHPLSLPLNATPCCGSKLTW